MYTDKTQKHTKKHKLQLATVFIDGCMANTCKSQMPEIVVPPVPATDVVSSKILHITYELKVKAHYKCVTNDSYQIKSKQWINDLWLFL